MFYDINICFFSMQDWENHDTQLPKAFQGITVNTIGWFVVFSAWQAWGDMLCFIQYWRWVGWWWWWWWLMGVDCGLWTKIKTKKIYVRKIWERLIFISPRLSSPRQHRTTAVPMWCTEPHPLYNRLVIPQASQLLLQHSEGNNNYRHFSFTYF